MGHTFNRLRTRTAAGTLVAAACLSVCGLTLALAAEAKQLFSPTELVHRKVDLVLRSGEKLHDVEVVKVYEGKIAGSIRMLTVKETAEGEPHPYSAAMIRSLSPGANAAGYLFDEKSKQLLPDDPAAQARIHEQTAKSSQESTATPESEGHGSAAKSGGHAENAAKGTGDRPGMPARKKKKSPFDLPLRAGVYAWPELTGEESKAAISSSKDQLKKLQEFFKQNRFTFVETKYFLFMSDLSPADLQLYIPYMDAMYNRMIGLFDIKAGTNIWKGKATVIIFAEQDDFQQYEARFLNEHPPDGVQALCHPGINGEVIITGHTTHATREYLAQVLVHETTHGFLWRYKSRTNVALWANEGLAEFIASVIVPSPRGVGFRAKSSVAQMQQTKSIGSGFFGEEQIDSFQYGVACDITRYLVTSDPKKYRLFIEGFKAGMDDQESLKNAYGVTREEMIQLYGRSLGIPALH